MRRRARPLSYWLGRWFGWTPTGRDMVAFLERTLIASASSVCGPENRWAGEDAVRDEFCRLLGATADA